MNNLAIIGVTSFLCLSSAYGALQNQQDENSKWLEKHQKITLFNLRNHGSNWYRLEVEPILGMSSLNFLEWMGLADDGFFTLFWYSYGIWKRLPLGATGSRFIKLVKNWKVEKLFDTMKDNYERYLKEKVLKEFLSPKILKASKEALLVQAMSLYYGKFYSIWKRLANSGSEKFDKLQLMFLFLQRAINNDIYDLLDFAFNEATKNLESSNEEIIHSHKDQFHWLAKFLSNDDSENWGLGRIANHSNPRFILCYFLYQKYSPWYAFAGEIHHGFKYLRDDLNLVLYFLRAKMDNKFNLKDPKEKELEFYPDFKSPFPSEIMGDDDLKEVLATIFSKLFCYNCYK